MRTSCRGASWIKPAGVMLTLARRGSHTSFEGIVNLLDSHTVTSSRQLLPTGRWRRRNAFSNSGAYFRENTPRSGVSCSHSLREWFNGTLAPAIAKLLQKVDDML